jgi:hypothetical protein
MAEIDQMLSQLLHTSPAIHVNAGKVRTYVGPAKGNKRKIPIDQVGDTWISMAGADNQQTIHAPLTDDPFVRLHLLGARRLGRDQQVKLVLG